MPTHTATLLIALLATSHVGAQTVYKCADTNGAPIFSQRPCSTDPSQVTTVEVRAVGREDGAARARVEQLTRAQQLDADQRACVRSGINPIIDDSDARIRSHRQRIVSLEAKATRARNNLAGATWEAGLRQEIAAITTAISAEHSSRDALVASVRDRCADARNRAQNSTP